MNPLPKTTILVTAFCWSGNSIGRWPFKAVRGFRTISAMAAAVVAEFPPFELQALRCREIYFRTRGLLGRVCLLTSRFRRDQTCTIVGGPTSIKERPPPGLRSSRASRQNLNFKAGRDPTLTSSFWPISVWTSCTE